jgi:hypothetical protein
MAIVHLNASRLAPGDIIPTGNFGRLLRELHNGVPGSDGRVYVLGMVAREYLFEVVRRDLRPGAPSRLTCVFACPTEIDAELYAVENNPQHHMHAYEVEPTDAKASTHIAALSHCTMTSGTSFIDLMEPKAQLYWEGTPGDPTKGWEILFSCPLRVVRAL